MTKDRMFGVLRHGATCAPLALSLVVLMMGDVTRAEIVHRYSFKSDASDSVGGADGRLFGRAVVTDGRLVLDGTTDTYMSLPIGASIAGLQSITVEAWVTWNTATDQNWSRIFDFGINTSVYMFLSPRNGATERPRFAITITGGGSGEEETSTLPRFPVGRETHIAVTLDGDLGVIALYVNGMPDVIAYRGTLKPSDLGNTPNNYLGKSQWPDPYFNGSYKEFRVYNTALSADAVHKSFIAGPDAP